MKKSYFIIMAFVVVLYSQLHAQVVPASKDSLEIKKIVYFFSIQTGALLGSDQVSFSSSTIHGVRIGKKLRVGAGVGFDSFGDSQVLPLFGSASWDVFSKKNAVFVQMNYGYAPVAWSPSLKDDYWFDKIKGGEMFSAMLGYRITHGDVHMALLAGYRHQEVEIYYGRYDYYLYNYVGTNPYPSNSQVICKSMNRFAVSLSVGWR